MFVPTLQQFRNRGELPEMRRKMRDSRFGSTLHLLSYYVCEHFSNTKVWAGQKNLLLWFDWKLHSWGDWIQIIAFPSLFIREKTFVTPCSSPPRQVPSENGSALKRKNVLLMAGGHILFFWNIPFFSREEKPILTECLSKNVPIPFELTCFISCFHNFLHINHFLTIPTSHLNDYFTQFDWLMEQIYTPVRSEERIHIFLPPFQKIDIFGNIYNILMTKLEL